MVAGPRATESRQLELVNASPEKHVRKTQTSSQVLVAIGLITFAGNVEAHGRDMHVVGSSNAYYALKLAGEAQETAASVTEAAGGSPITLKVVAGGSRSPFGRWLAEAMTESRVRRSGTVITGDAQGRPTTGIEFTDAELSEIKFGTLANGVSVQDNNALFLTVTISPSRSANRTMAANGPPLNEPLRGYSTPNARLNIEGLDEASVQHSEVKAFTIRPGEPCPALTLRVSAQFAGTFIKANSVTGAAREQQKWPGSLELFTPGAAVAYHFQFTGLRLTKLEERTNTSVPDEYHAEFSCEKATLR